MNDSSAEPSGLNRAIRWIARGWSIASIGFVLLILVGELVYPHAPAPTEFRDLLGLFLFPFCTCLGMILAWRWEGLGGTITIGSLLAFYAALRIMDGRCSRWTVLCARGSARIVVPLLVDTGRCKDKGQHGVAIR